MTENKSSLSSRDSMLSDIYCKYCRYYKSYWSSDDFPIEQCRFEYSLTIKDSCIERFFDKNWKNPYKKNKNKDCKDFKKKWWRIYDIFKR